MFTVKNISLDAIFKKYNTTSLDTLSQDQLLDVCNQLRVIPKWNVDKKNRITDLDYMTTIQMIIGQYTASTYMGSAYWTTAIRENITKLKLLPAMSKHLKGEETLETMANVGYGLYNLKPGQTATLKTPLLWIKQELLFSGANANPIGTLLEIRDEHGNIVNEGYDPDAITAKVTAEQTESLIESATTVTKGLDPEALDYPDLKKYVAEVTGQKVAGVSKENLLEMLQKHQLNITNGTSK